MNPTSVERLVVLFYLLMRDGCPTGAVSSAIEQSLGLGADVSFTNKELEQMSRRYVARFTS